MRDGLSFGASHASPRRAAGKSGWALLWLAALAAGAWMRIYQLPMQIILDDEWHAVHKLLHAGYSNIATHFGFADYSIPLTLYFRYLHDHGGLSEWAMHLPSLIAGLALLAIGPPLVWRWVGRQTAATWAALAAISPMLVYLAKTARPYAWTSLLTFVALVAFWRWWHRHGHARAWGAVYVFATALAGWFHLVTLPYTLWPFLYCGVRQLVRIALRESRRDGSQAMLRLVALGVLTSAAVAALLLPPLIMDWTQFSAKAGTDDVTAASLYRTLLMLVGTGYPIPGIGLLTLALAGAMRLYHRDRDLALYLLTTCIGGALAIASTRPAWVFHPAVFARYCVPVLPVLLVFVAEGCSLLVQGIPWPRIRPLAIGLGAAGLVFAGPIPGYFYFPNQFMGHLRFQYDYPPEPQPYARLGPPEPMPEFYRELGKLPPGSLTLIEAPWRLESHWNPLPWYQQVHRQRVMIGMVTPVCGVHEFGEFPEDPGMRFRYLAHLSAVLRGETYGARYLVLHLHSWKTPSDGTVVWPDMTACVERVESALGPPLTRDSELVVFELKH